MNGMSRKSIIGSSTFLALLIVGLVIFSTYLSARITASVDFETAKTTTATILAVIAVDPKSPVSPGSNDALYRVCFTIDNLDQINIRNRNGYRAAELHRLSKEGPRRKATSNVALARTLSDGFKIQVVYLQENGYQLSIARIEVQGKEL